MFKIHTHTYTLPKKLEFSYKHVFENMCCSCTFPALQGPGPGPYGPEKFKNIRKQLALIGALRR